MSRDEKYVHQWIEIADRDLERARKRSAEEDFEDAGFRLQQAVEKYLKAFLIAHDWELQKTHNLVRLLEEACEFDASLVEFANACMAISDYYFENRYPRIMEEPLTESDVRQAIASTELLRQRLLETIV